LSIIIALYNQENEIKICLDSIFKSKWKKFEVIVVNDCSTDNSLEVAKNYPCKIFNTKENSGPAKARNIGTENSRSEIFFFLDADTKVRNNTLEMIYNTFKKNPKIWALVALPNINSLKKGNAPDHNALKNHYTLYSAKKYSNYFTTQMGGIRKKYFNKIGGFNQKFESADIEDIEFGLKIPKGKTLITKDIIIGHHFPDFKNILKKYFRRATMFTDLVRRTKTLSETHSNMKNTISVFLIMFNLVSIFFMLFHPLSLALFLITGSIFLVLNKDFIVFSTRKRGLNYLPKFFFFEYIFSIAIGMGGVIGMMKCELERIMKFIEKYFSLMKMFLVKKPTYLIFYVTSICNSRCKMCFNWKYNTKKILKKELKLKEIEKISKKMGHLQYVTLGGGEPFLRKDLDEICEIFYKNNRTRAFSIPTNCLSPNIIQDKTLKMVGKCPDAIFRISMSIDGIKDLHDYIRGVKGNFGRVVETYGILNDLRNRHPNIEILANTTFSSYNQDKIKEIHDYIQQNFKLDMHGLTLVRGNTRNLVSKKIDIKKYEEALRMFENNIYKIKYRHPFQKILRVLPIITRREVLKTARSTKRTYNCHAIKRMIVIDSFGNVFPCEMLPEKIGNLRNNGYDIQKILEKEGTKKILKSIKNKECNCTWECAIQNSIIFNPKKYPSIILHAIKK